MSGFYGIYRYDGAPIDPTWLARMKDAMAYYGPDGCGQTIQGPIGLGHLLLKVNPEDCFEKQPIRCERGLIVSAARLDNRDELLEALDIPSAEAPQISDGHLVSLAFDRWGEDIGVHLQGDWALAAWDARNRRLLLTRDAFGNSTLYYYEGKEFIAFASGLKALLALPGAVKQPDMLRLAEVLVAWQHDAELTAYKDFRRLLWADAIRVDHQGQSRIWHYWSHEGREFLKYHRDEDYEEAFLELYSRAVKNCLRTPRPVAATLSAGRDSGSIVSLAAPILADEGRTLQAYTSVPYFSPDFTGERYVENEESLAYSTAVLAGSNVHHLPVDAADYGIVASMLDVIDAHDGPSHAPGNHFWINAIMDVAAHDGCAVVLTGMMGNATISWDGNGSALLALMQGQAATALRLFLHADANKLRLIKEQVIRPIASPMLRMYGRLQNPHSWQDSSALNFEMAETLNLRDRMREAKYDVTRTFSPLADFRARYFSPRDFCVGSSILAEIASRRKLSCLHPPANLALTEFLLSVPDDQFCREGRKGDLFKRVFRNRLPHDVVNATWLGVQSSDLGHRILRELASFQEHLQSLERIPNAREILNLPLLRSCLTDLSVNINRKTSLRASMILLRGLGVGLFLRSIAEGSAINRDIDASLVPHISNTSTECRDGKE